MHTRVMRWMQRTMVLAPGIVNRMRRMEGGAIIAHDRGHHLSGETMAGLNPFDDCFTINLATLSAPSVLPLVCGVSAAMLMRRGGHVRCVILDSLMQHFLHHPEPHSLTQRRQGSCVTPIDERCQPKCGKHSGCCHIHTTRVARAMCEVRRKQAYRQVCKCR